MEYDRALYRVYERIIEDLNMSSNPMETPPPPPPSSSTISGSIYSPSGAVRYDGAPSSPSSVHSRNSLRRRRRRRVMSTEEDGTQDDSHSSSGVNNANNSNQEEAVPPSSPTGSSNNSSRRRRRQMRAARQNRVMLQQQQQQQQQQLGTRRGQSQPLPLPFIMPIWMAKKLDVMNSTRSGSGNNNLVASPRATNNDGYITDAWRSLRNVLLLGRGGATYESVSTTAQQLSLPSGYSPGSLSNHRDSDDNFQTTPPRDVEEMQLGVEELSLPMLEESSPSSRSSEGLRRRSPSSPSTPRRSSPRHSASSSPSRRTSPPSIPNSPNLSQSSSTSSSSTSSGGERAAPLSPPTVSLTQRAIQLQMRQAQLHSRGSSEMQNDSDSESYDSADELVNDDSEHDSASSTSSDSNAENEERNDAGCSRKNVYGMMRLSFAVGVFHIFVLVALHVTYVGPYAFRKPGLSGFMERMSARRSLANDLDNLDNPGSRGAKFLRKLLEREEKKDIADYPDHALINCISYALSTRPENERSKYFAMFGDSDSKRRKLLSADDDSGGDDDYDLVENKHDAYGIPRHHRKMIESKTEAETKSPLDGAIPFLGKDEILQIKIMYGGICTGQCSQVRHVDYQNKTLHQDDTKVRMLNQGSQRGLSFLRARKIRNIFGDDIYSSPSYWEEPHYRFSLDDALLYLDDSSALIHNITNVNITVTERCLSTGRDDGKLTFFTAVGEFFSQIYGMDSVIINQLMYGIRGSAGSLQSGYLLNSATKERWGWTKQQLEAYEGNDSVVDWFFKKLGALILSFLAFFLVTTVTSLIVRVLTSSGVALMFPLFSFFRRMGMSGADERILAMSYPWIGIAHTAIRNRNIHPQSHLIWAHLAKILLYYIMYEACQAAWSVVLYAKSIPESLPVWIYGMAMILEYFSMVFVRSALSAHFFPRICLIYLMAYHLYFYSVPYGFFDVALIPLFSFLVHSMMYTILAFECGCVGRGVISVETPREVYNKLSWPEWSAQLPSEWTMFLPLNARHTPIHDRVTTEVNSAQQNANAAAAQNET